MTELRWQPRWAVPYGVILWERQAGEQLFSSGRYTCNTEQTFVSNTMAKSCADLLSLETGRLHRVENQSLGYLERGNKEESGSHLQVHQVRSTSEPLDPVAYEVLKATFRTDQPPPSFADNIVDAMLSFWNSPQHYAKNRWMGF